MTYSKYKQNINTETERSYAINISYYVLNATPKGSAAVCTDQNSSCQTVHKAWMIGMITPGFGFDSSVKQS